MFLFYFLVFYNFGETKMSGDDLIPIELVSTPATELLRQRQRKRRRSLYLPGLPATVCERAVSVSPAAAILLQVIGLQARLNKSLEVALQSSLASSFGIEARQRRRLLTVLAEAGFISLEKAPGKRSTITVTDEEFAQWLFPGGRGAPSA